MIAYIVKASIALVIFYVFYRAFLVKESMFQFTSKIQCTQIGQYADSCSLDRFFIIQSTI